MNKLHVKLLDMYSNIRAEFIKNSVRHFAIGGTAIGAFRESGFIPWDDDMDIAFFEEDMELFKKSVLDAGYSFEDVSLSAQPMIKVFDRKSTIDIKGHKQFLFMDFMIAQKEREWSNTRWAFQNLLNTIGASKSLTFGELKRIEGTGPAIGYKILSGVTFFIRGSYLKSKIIQRMVETKLAQERDDNYRYLYHVRRTEKYNVSNIIELPFENTKMFVNEGFQDDMFDVFGDIMKAPDQNQIENHDIGEVIDND